MVAGWKVHVGVVAGGKERAVTGENDIVVAG